MRDDPELDTDVHRHYIESLLIVDLVKRRKLYADLVLILGSRANGNSGKSMMPCLPASGQK